MHATCRCFWVQRVAELLGAPLFVSLQHYIARGCTSMLSIPQLAAGCGFNGECAPAFPDLRMHLRVYHAGGHWQQYTAVLTYHRLLTACWATMQGSARVSRTCGAQGPLRIALCQCCLADRSARRSVVAERAPSSTLHWQAPHPILSIPSTDCAVQPLC